MERSRNVGTDGVTWTWPPGGWLETLAGMSSVAPRALGQKAPTKERTEMADKWSKDPEETARVRMTEHPSHKRAR